MKASDVRSGLERGEMFPLYQPQVLPDGRTIVAVEALIRWRRPGVGLVAPEAFIPFAERSSLIVDVGCFVLACAVRDSLRWPGLVVAVNVSPVEFAPGYAEMARETVMAQGADPARIELELTESALMNDPELCRAEIDRLRGYGFRIALDDFGAGYSSLAYLRDLPIDKLKIDRAFIRETGNMRGAAIVHAIVALGRALGLKVTAEGVETPEQQAFLKAAGCHALQGYLFARPGEVQTIDRLLAAQAPAQRLSA